MDNICYICYKSLDSVKLATLETCEHKFCLPCIHQWARKSKNKCPLCKKRFNKIKTKDLDTKFDLHIEVPDKDIDADEEMSADPEQYMCRVCNKLIEQSEYAIECPYCARFGFLLHLACVKSNNLIDPNTGEYTCKDCSTSRCDKCYRIYNYPSDIAPNYFQQNGCPFCKDIELKQKDDLKQYSLLLLNQTFVKLEYNEFAIQVYRKSKEISKKGQL